MENISDKKPCAVEKIETSQGFSVYYKNLFLYSKYNPSKNIVSYIDKLQLLPGTIILCCSPLLGYGIKELSDKLPENCLLILCEAEKELYDFTIAECSFDKTDKRLIFCSFDSLNFLPFKVFDLASSGLYKRVIKIDFSAGVKFHNDFYEKLAESCTDSIMTFWKNRITLTKFGRRYSKNLFENLHYLSDSKPITDYFEKIERPIIVFGAGESTDNFLKHNKINTDDYFILCVDTALQPLLKNGIKPYGVFIEEAQAVIMKAFIGCIKDTHFFAGLSSNPNISHITDNKNISYFFTEYTKASFIESLKQESFMPPANKPFGSVGLTTVYYALKFRKNQTIPVYVCGLDFSYSTGITHTRGALAHILRLISSNRLTSISNFSAAFGAGTEKINDKKGKILITTPTLKNYSMMFKSFFAGEKNLYDLGNSGIDLGLPMVDRLENKETCKIEDSYNCKESIQVPSHSKEIKEYLDKEKNSLLELRDLLTGKTDLKGQALLEEIKKIAEGREYLYLHFADGYKFELNQSFLNRIRTEIDFFLKFL